MNVRITESINYGNLTGLIGTWQGDNGFNMIAVPDQKGGFNLLVCPYTETLVVNAVPATTPNRGLKTIANIPTLQYFTRILDTSTNPNSLIHVENGFWELVNPLENDGFDIFRLASIPHGVALVAMGVSAVSNSAPLIDPDLSGLPTGDLPDRSGYTDSYGFPFKYPQYDPGQPNLYLINSLKQQLAGGLTVKQTVELRVSTLNDGGISNIPSIVSNTNATQFDATFWLETLEDSSGHITQQLQYSQRTLIQFPINSNSPGQTIVWPHINVNTLTLQPPVA